MKLLEISLSYIFFPPSLLRSDIGPEVGFEATGIINAKLPTTGIWARAADDVRHLRFCCTCHMTIVVVLHVSHDDSGCVARVT